jgi:hypothetical protein
MLAYRVGYLFYLPLKASAATRRDAAGNSTNLGERKLAEERCRARRRGFSAGEGVLEAAGIFTFSHEEETRRRDDTRSPAEALASVAPCPTLN